MDTIEKIITNAKREKWSVVLYGLGQLGCEAGVQLLNWLDLKPDFACDKNDEAIRDFCTKNVGVNAMPLENLLSWQKETLVLVCVGMVYVSEVQAMLQANSSLHIITIDDVSALDCILERFYQTDNIAKKIIKMTDVVCDSSMYSRTDSVQDRIAIFTCVTGGYDLIREPLYTEEKCDYYLISDKNPGNLKVYQYIDVNEIVPDDIEGSAEKNRWCKMHAYAIFSSYRYSIYIDGVIRLIRPISHYINMTGRFGIALHRHPVRDCIFEEGFRLIINKRANIDYDGLRSQMLRYMEEGMPRKYGLFECGMVVRNHNIAEGNKIMDEWFKEYMNGQKRDQLSFTYILWKNAISTSLIGVLNQGKDIRCNPDLEINENHGLKG